MLVALVLLAACAAPQPSPQAAEPAKPAEQVLTSRVERIALFKNGLAFARRVVSVPSDARRIELNELPPPVHGSFWLAADPERLAIGPAVARRSRVTETVEAGDLLELLHANVGRKLILLVGEEELVGTLVAMPESEAAMQPWQAWPPPDLDPRTRSWRGKKRELLLLDTEAGRVGLSPAQVRRVRSSDGPLALEIQREREAVALNVEVTPKGAGPVPLNLLYLEHGLLWAPSYAIDLGDPERALLTAKAEVIAEGEALEGATLELVTGFPNLKFAHVVGPTAMQGDLRAFLAALAGAGADAMSAVMGQRVLSNVASAEAGASFPLAGPPAEGEAVEDLFFYELPDVTLARGERGLFQLFSVRVPYEHVHEWKIPDEPDPGYGRQPDAEREEEVWHSVRLTNDATLPWTTAPAMTMKGGRLLGQDTLSYTAAGADVTVRITRAVDVAAEQAEHEIARDPQTIRVYGNSYWRITRRGELRVTNRKREAIRLEITRRVEGEIVSNPDGAEAVRLPDRRISVNPGTRLRWSIPLEPGATRELSYEYTILVRS